MTPQRRLDIACLCYVIVIITAVVMKHYGAIRMKETKYICDGCGRTLNEGQDGKSPMTPMKVGDGEYDLCVDCVKRQKARLEKGKGQRDDSIIGNYKWAAKSLIGAGDKAVGFVRRRVEGRSKE